MFCEFSDIQTRSLKFRVTVFLPPATIHNQINPCIFYFVSQIFIEILVTGQAANETQDKHICKMMINTFSNLQPPREGRSGKNSLCTGKSPRGGCEEFPSRIQGQDGAGTNLKHI